MPRSRTETWAAVIVGCVALAIAALLGLWGYMSLTATPLHPDANAAPSIGAPAAAAWSSVIEQSRQAARQALSEQNLPGLSIAVGVAGEIVWAEGFGWTDLEAHTPVTPRTPFRIGTASIPFTAAAVGRLLEKNQLTLDEPIRTRVPEFPDTQRPITLRQLMAHTSGMPDDGGDEGPLFSKRCDRPADAFQYLSGSERTLLFDPDTRYSFSKYGWIAVSAAVEAAADRPFLSVMRQEVFEPLGLEQTDADSANAPLPGQATSYFPRFAADPRYGPDVMRPLDYSCYSGASVFVSTPSDLVRFAMAVNGGRLLQPSTVQRLQTPQRLISGEDTPYGLGWMVEIATLAGRETRWVGHNGSLLGGRVASLMMFPERGLVVGAIANTSYADTKGVALTIAQAFAKRSESAPAQ